MASTSEKELEIIKKDNRLIQARYRVGLHEQRILYAVLGAIRVDDKGFDTYTIDLRQLAQMHGITASNDLYRQIQEAAEQLLVTIVDISMGNRTRKTTWLNYVEYVAGEAELKVTIHEKLKPYLLQLKKPTLPSTSLQPSPTSRTPTASASMSFSRCVRTWGKVGSFI